MSSQSAAAMEQEVVEFPLAQCHAVILRDAAIFCACRRHLGVGEQGDECRDSSFVEVMRSRRQLRRGMRRCEQREQRSAATVMNNDARVAERAFHHHGVAHAAQTREPRQQKFSVARYVFETKRRRDRFQRGERATALRHRVAEKTLTTLDFAEREVDGRDSRLHHQQLRPSPCRRWCCGSCRRARGGRATSGMHGRGASSARRRRRGRRGGCLVYPRAPPRLASS